MDILDILKGGAGSPAARVSAPAQRGRGGWTPVNYDESRGSLIAQIRALANGRPILGTRDLSNYLDQETYVPEQVLDGGDAGTSRTVYKPREGSGLRGSNETGVYFVGADDQDWMRVPLSAAPNADEGFSARELGLAERQDLRQMYLGITPAEWSNYSEEERNNILDSRYFKPDSLHGFGELEFGDEQGLVAPSSSYRDPDIRRDNWLGALMMAAVAAPAIGGIAAIEGAGTTGASGGAMDMGVGLDEVATNWGSTGLGEPAVGAPAFEPATTPSTNPWNFEGPPDGPGPTGTEGNPYGIDTTPMNPVEVPTMPEVDPSQMIDYQGQDWFDRMLRAARGLPSLMQGMGGSSRPGGSAASGGSGGGISGGGSVSSQGGSGRGGGNAVGDSSAFTKGGLTNVGDLLQYLRGTAK